MMSIIQIEQNQGVFYIIKRCLPNYFTVNYPNNMDVIRALIKESVNTVERLRELMFPMTATLNTVSGCHWAVIGNILATSSQC